MVCGPHAGYKLRILESQGKIVYLANTQRSTWILQKNSLLSVNTENKLTTTSYNY